MKYVGDIAEDGTVQAIADGAITDGATAIVNADGTVSGVTDALTASIGSAVLYNGQAVDYNRAVFDSHNNRIVVVYTDQASSPYKGAAIVGTVSGTSVSYGTEVVFETGVAAYISITFDSTSNRVVIVYRDGNNSSYGTAIVGLVDSSDNSISFGTPVVYHSGSSLFNSCTFDSTNNRIVVTHRTNAGGSQTGVAIVGTVDNSDNSISFGTPVVFNNHESQYQYSTFDSSNGKVVIAFQDGQNVSGTGRGNAIVGNVDPSDNSISFGSKVDFSGAINANYGTPITFDSNSNKIVVMYSKYTDSNKGYAKVGTVSGTSISFGSETAFESGSFLVYKAITFDSSVNKVVMVYDYNETDLKYVVGTVSGTSISFGTAVVFSTGNDTAEGSIDVTFDSSNNKSVIVFRDQSNSNYGTSQVFQNAQPTTLTTENFIGVTDAAYATGQKATIKTTGSIARNVPQQPSSADALGSAVEYTTASSTGNTTRKDVAFDSNSNRVVVAYNDDANSSSGTARVGTINPADNSTSYGTAVIFSTDVSAEASFPSAIFDSNSNRVVISYSNSGDSDKGKAVVVSVNPANNSLTVGTPVTYNNATTYYPIITFDSNSNRVLIVYKDVGNSNYLTSIVGSVDPSDNSITFGSEVVIASANYSYIACTFDSSNNKAVVVYRGASGHGQANVGTINPSNNSVSWGSVANFHDSSAPRYLGATFDTNSNKVVISYHAGDVSSKGHAVVGTVSGTDITFGTPVVFEDAATTSTDITFDSSNNKVVIVYMDDANSDYGTYIVGTVSGTAISFGTAVVFSAATTKEIVNVFDSGINRVITVYTTSAGFSKVLALAGTPEDLTAGQQYFVQTDGSLGTTAATPSVIAGTAISASELIVKG
jgi:hypothetical protein